MKHNLLFPILAMLLLVVGCTVYSAVSFYKEDQADFTKYNTYAWLTVKDNSNNVLNIQIMRNNIKNYFSREFVDHYGLTNSTGTPDVPFGLKVTVFNKVKANKHTVTTTTPNYPYSYSYAYNNYPNNNYSSHKYYSPQPNPYNYNRYYSGYRYQRTYIKHEHKYKESNITINRIDNSKRNELVRTVTAQTDIYASESKNV